MVPAWADHSGIADEEAAGELPAAQVFLDPADRGDVDGVAGKHPMPHLGIHLAVTALPHHDLRRFAAACSCCARAEELRRISCRLPDCSRTLPFWSPLSSSSISKCNEVVS